MSGDESFETVVGLFDDEFARMILKATSTQPLSATELAERTGASQQTMYRRLERLQDAGLIEEATKPRPDGHHETVYLATLEQATIRLRNGSFEFELKTREKHMDTADVLTDLWRQF